MTKTAILTLAIASFLVLPALAEVRLEPLDAAYVATLKSNDAEYGVVVRFQNKAPFGVEVLWIDYSGAIVSFGTVLPGENMSQATYLGHPWLVREMTGKMMLVGFIPRAACSIEGCVAEIDGTFVPVAPVTWGSIKSRYP